MTKIQPQGSSKPNRPVRFQFGLKALLGTLLLLCVVVGLCSQSGFVGVAYSWFVFLGVAFVVAVWRRQLWMMSASFALFLLSCVFLPAFFGSLPRKRGPSPCHNNLRSISRALQNYHAEHGSFPPPYLADDNSLPMHSWRILILPFLGPEEADLYKQYRFDEPWYGPNNRKLVEKMPSVYRCPNKKRRPGDFTTDYVAVTGPNTMWPVDQTVRISDVTDGTSNTLIVVESVNCGICWLEPLDLDVDSIPMTINPKSKRGISSVHTGGVLGALVDGSVQYFPDSMPSNTLKALLIRNDGQEVDLSDF